MPGQNHSLAAGRRVMAICGAVMLSILAAGPAASQVRLGVDHALNRAPGALIDRRIEAAPMTSFAHFMAIAASRDGRVVATGGLHADQARASVEAGAACRQQAGGQSCFVLVSFRNNCGGWATDSRGAAWGELAGSRSAAESQARRACVSHSADPRSCQSGAICTPGRS